MSADTSSGVRTTRTDGYRDSSHTGKRRSADLAPRGRVRPFKGGRCQFVEFAATTYATMKMSSMLRGMQCTRTARAHRRIKTADGLGCGLQWGPVLQRPMAAQPPSPSPDDESREQLVDGTGTNASEPDQTAREQRCDCERKGRMGEHREPPDDHTDSEGDQ